MSLPKPRPDLAGLAGYHSPQLDVQVRLNTNESPFPPPPAFVDAWLARLREVPLHRYPDREAVALRAALGTALVQPPERLFAANGSNEVLQTLLLTYGGPGRRALVFEPTYALHAHVARVTGTGLVEGERAEDFSLSAPGASELVEATRPNVVLVCSPNNPTGTVEPRATIETLLAAVAESGCGLLVVDEAYGEFADWSATELVADDRPLVVVRTYSKVWSLAGLRLGVAIAPSPVVAELAKTILPYHLSVATQLAGVEALRFDAEMRERVGTLVRERGRLTAALEALPGLRVFPSGANFVLVHFAGNGHALWERLVDRGVLVRDFSRWPRLDDCLRITVGTESENDAALSALREAIEEAA